MRDAEDHNEVASGLQTLVGHPVKKLSGKEESQCLMEGVNPFCKKLFSAYLFTKQTIYESLGSGSLEISLIESAGKIDNIQNNILYGFDIGTLRLGKRSLFCRNKNKD